jgi:hypothetical protein
MRYMSDIVQGLLFVGLGAGAIYLALEGLVRGELRVVGRSGIAVVSRYDAWLYWGVEALYLIGGLVAIAFAMRYCFLRNERRLSD